MATRLYSLYNGAAPGASAAVKQPTGAVIRSMQQIATSATAGLEIIEWGISFDGAAAATPGTVELIISTGGAVSTLTANVGADIARLSYTASGLASTVQLGGALTGFNNNGAGTEATPTGPRLVDQQLLPPTAPYIKQFPLERGPTAQNSEFIRVRVTFASSINALCYIVWAE